MEHRCRNRHSNNVITILICGISRMRDGMDLIIGPPVWIKIAEVTEDWQTGSRQMQSKISWLKVWLYSRSQWRVSSKRYSVLSLQKRRTEGRRNGAGNLTSQMKHYSNRKKEKKLFFTWIAFHSAYAACDMKVEIRQSDALFFKAIRQKSVLHWNILCNLSKYERDRVVSYPRRDDDWLKSLKNRFNGYRWVHAAVRGRDEQTFESRITCFHWLHYTGSILHHFTCLINPLNQW